MILNLNLYKIVIVMMFILVSRISIISKFIAKNFESKKKYANKVNNKVRTIVIEFTIDKFLISPAPIIKVLMI